MLLWNGPVGDRDGQSLWPASAGSSRQGTAQGSGVPRPKKRGCRPYMAPESILLKRVYICTLVVLSLADIATHFMFDCQLLATGAEAVQSRHYIIHCSEPVYFLVLPVESLYTA